MLRVEESLPRVNTAFGGNVVKQKKNGYMSANLNPIPFDSISLSNKQNVAPLIKTTRNGNVLRVSFGAALQNPIQPSIQMKVRGVTAHQKGGIGIPETAKDNNVIKLADSDWKEGRELKYRIKKGMYGTRIILEDPEFGPIGRVPDEIVPDIAKLLKRENNIAANQPKTSKRAAKKAKKKQDQATEPKSDFRFELSNVIAGNSKGAPTIGLRVNLKYVGNNPKLKNPAQVTFDRLLNSEDKYINDSVMLYQPKATPDEVLQRIFDVEGKANGPETVKEMKEAIGSITKEINDPKNKNILILGHCKPDGDTLGCVIGMKTAIKGAFPDKNIDCAVDDKIPGLFRHKMPGIEDVKRPYNPERIKTVEKNIETLKLKEQNETTKSQISMLEKELKELQDVDNLFDINPLFGEEKQKYDLVMIMDVPTPKRFTSAFKDYIENAGKVIYIDHHPHRINEWQDAKNETGVDMEKIHDDKLALVAESVPAATQLVTILADKAGILNKTMQDSFENAKKYVASVITGTSTDTGSFTRTANLLPEHMDLPASKRPNFLPEGMSKWLIDELGKNPNGKVDKKWLRDNITFDVPDRELSNKPVEDGVLSPREKMLTYAVDGRTFHEGSGIGFISVDYDQMYEIWQDSLKQDEDMTLLDVQNGFKYCEVMGALKADPDKVATQQKEINPFSSLDEKAKYMYQSPYNDDKIAVLIIQDKKEGCITENSDIAEQNGLRLSFRSSGASNHAELLASLFGGGGHGGAAGGRVDLPNVTLDTKLCIKINGETVTDYQTVYEDLKNNYEVLHNANYTADEQRAMTKDIHVELAPDGEGENTEHLIYSITKCIRDDQKAKQEEEINGIRNNENIETEETPKVIPFSGNFFKMKKA